MRIELWLQRYSPILNSDVKAAQVLMFLSPFNLLAKEMWFVSAARFMKLEKQICGRSVDAILQYL